MYRVIVTVRQQSRLAHKTQRVKPVIVAYDGTSLPRLMLKSRENALESVRRPGEPRQIGTRY